ncbi:MAG: hypothetical protein U0Y68_14455 [Blastocatellia bacterium]
MKVSNAVLPLLLFWLLSAEAWAQAKPTATLPDKLTNAEFVRLMTEMSEPGGDFLSDNLISNETAYLPVLAKLKELNATGGAYLGVGPEQNFTYIAKIRPRIAFILDIRHLAATHHLLYKALFHLSPERGQFLARLLSRPLAKDKPLAANVAVPEMLEYFARTKAEETYFTATLAEVRKTIEKDFGIKLSEFDGKELDYVLRSFKNDGIDIAFRFGGGWSYFPSLREVIAQTDPNGKYGHFLANAEDYEFVRQLQMKNLVIPITGDFGGKKALAAIGDYLRQNNLTVTAYYLSNVEQYLFQDYTFGAFVANVKKLPINDQSLFIRSVLDRYDHPTHTPGHLFTMLMQRIGVFVKDYDEGKYKEYYQLVNTNYIGLR